MESDLQSTINNKCLEAVASSTGPSRDAKFVAMLPRIHRQAAYYLRHLSGDDRAEAIQEVVVNAFVSWVRLTERGKSDVAYAGPLARYGACQYLSGRRVGSRMNGHDVMSSFCQRRKGIVVERLDCFDAPNDEWQEIVVENKLSGPAEIATTRIDFGAWLAQLAGRTRQIARDLAYGYSTSEVACRHGISKGRVSQLRGKLKASWAEFQHEPVAGTR